MVNQVQPAPFRALDDNGASAGGAKAYFYETGTTDPVTVYADADLQVALPWPLVADANGYFEQVFYDGAGAVKVRIFDADDVLLWEADPAPQLPLSASGAAQIGFEPTTAIPVTNVQAAIEAVQSNLEAAQAELTTTQALDDWDDALGTGSGVYVGTLVADNAPAYPGDVDNDAETDGWTATTYMQGTYAQAAYTVTVSLVLHGFSVGQAVHLDFLTGNSNSGIYTVETVADANTFTVTSDVSETSSGVVACGYRWLGQMIADGADDGHQILSRPDVDGLWTRRAHDGAWSAWAKVPTEDQVRTDILEIAGDAPTYFTRAWAAWSPTEVDVPITYARVGTTVTATLVDHGYQAGHRIQLDVTSGTLADGTYAITNVVDDDTFEFVSGTSGATSGGGNIQNCTLLASGNVHSVARLGGNEFVVNFDEALPSANYAVSMMAANTTDLLTTEVGGYPLGTLSAKTFAGSSRSFNSASFIA